MRDANIRHGFRYAVSVVYPDGNPYEVAYSRSALAAMEAADAWPRDFPGEPRTCAYAWDTDDPETGSLHDGHPAVEREYDEQSEYFNGPLYDFMQTRTPAEIAAVKDTIRRPR